MNSEVPTLARMIKCFRAILVASVTFVLTVTVTSCSSGAKPTGNASSPAASAKPDIAALTDAMLLTPAEFPKIGDIECTVTKPVKTAESDEHEISFPSWHIDHPEGAVHSGAQAGMLECGSKSDSKLAVRMMVILQRPPVDLNSWATQYLPHGEFSRMDAAGVRSGVIAVGRKDAGDASPHLSGLVGYVRGVLVHVEGSLAGGSLSEDEANAELVAIFNHQADKLNAA